MTVSSTTNRNDYVGNGAVDTYSYTFRILDQTHLRVTVRDTSSPPVETPLTLTTHYIVSGVGDAGGGSVALVNGAFSWLDADGDLKSGYSLTIRRVLTIKQETDLRNQGSFYAETHEDQFDRAAMVAQQQQDEVDRALSLPETEAGSSAATTLPISSERASKFLAFDASGNPIASSGSGIPATAFAATVLDDADADSAIQTYIAALTAETAVAKDDMLIFGDTSEGKGNKVTLENALKVLTLLTAETAPAVGDELMLYDASATAVRKMTLANVLKIIGGLTADTSPLLTDEYVFYDSVGGAAYKVTLDNLLKVINSLTEDTTPDTAADYAVTYDASAAAVKKVLLNKLGGLNSKVGSFTRDVSLASGTQVVSGLTFNPKAFIFFAALSNTIAFSAGVDDATVRGAVVARGAGNYITAANGIQVELVAGTDIYTGGVSAKDATSFTITWTKIGSPTGTVTVYYLALG